MNAGCAVLALAFGMSLCFQIAQAQAGKVPRIGWLSVQPGPTVPSAFTEGLRQLGWYVGENIAIEARFARQRHDQLAKLAAELVQLNVDAIIVADSTVVPAARNATRTIPIIIMTVGDPVRSGYVASLAKPDGNITGLATNHGPLNGKRLEILKEAVPSVSRVAIFDPVGLADRGKIKRVSNLLGIQLEPLPLNHLHELEGLLKAPATRRVNGLMVAAGPHMSLHGSKLIQFASRNRLPTIYPLPAHAANGGLMAYGPNLGVIHRRAAYYVDRILKGAKPSDLPVERPLTAEFVINLKAAREIGLTFPPEVLQRADIIIR